MLPPEKITEKRIVQPGRYDGGKVPDDVVAEYVWHEKVYDVWEWGLGCPVSRAIDSLYLLFRRTSRVVGVEPNNLDFAVGRALVEVEEKTISGLPTEGMHFFGLIFAGTSYGHGAICKLVKYWPPALAGFEIPWPTQADVIAEDRVAKDGRTTCYKEAPVLLTSANLIVSYGPHGVAWFWDIAITDEGFCQPGDSGSPVFVLP